jgi:rubredoxin
MLRNIRTCPECGAKGAAEIQNTEEIVLSNSVDHRGRKTIRIKETKYIDHYQCSVCSHTWTRTFTQKERFKMDDLNPRQYQP